MFTFLKVIFVCVFAGFSTKMSSPKRRRITMKLKTPNPLFVQWLTEWRDKAKESDSKMQYAFNTALKALERFPLPLESGRDCKALKGFGDKLCKMLDDKLKRYKAQNGGVIPEFKTTNDENVEENKAKTPKKRKKVCEKSPLKSSEKEYIPQKKSGGYAILLCLYEESLKPNYAGFMLKNDVTRIAQKNCDVSFTKPDPGSFYTAWSSMKTLIGKSLVNKQGNPPKFSLTQEGSDLGEKLYIQKKIDDFQTEENVINTIAETESLPSCSSKSSNKNGIISKTNSVCLPSSSSEDFPKQSKTISKTNSVASSSANSFESVILPPNSFDIVLLVDKQELSKGDLILTYLTSQGTVHESRDLKIGDYVWVSRDKSTKTELVLPYIIERKRMDDLGSSIKDGRFHEQKFRLKQSGVKNLIYLIEEYGDNTRCGLDVKSLFQGATNTLVQDGFSVKFTKDLKETSEYLACLTDLIAKMFASKTLVSCAKDDVKEAVLDEDLAGLMTFQEFNKSASKTKRFNVHDMFIKQLLQISGVSVDKALAITDKYQTPRSLMNAYQEAGAVEGEKLLAKLQYGQLKKCIGPVTSRVIYQFFCNRSY